MKLYQRHNCTHHGNWTMYSHRGGQRPISPACQVCCLHIMLGGLRFIFATHVCCLDSCGLRKHSVLRLCRNVLGASASFAPYGLGQVWASSVTVSSLMSQMCEDRTGP
jgi:hypothetical protein